MVFSGGGPDQSSLTTRGKHLLFSGACSLIIRSFDSAYIVDLLGMHELRPLKYFNCDARSFGPVVVHFIVERVQAQQQLGGRQAVDENHRPSQFRHILPFFCTFKFSGG